MAGVCVRDGHRREHVRQTQCTQEDRERDNRNGIQMGANTFYTDTAGCAFPAPVCGHN